MLTRQQVESIEAQLARGKSLREVSRAVGVSREAVRRVRNGNRSYREQSNPPDGMTAFERQAMSNRPEPPSVYLPSAERIDRLCTAFRRRRPRKPVGCRGSVVLVQERGISC